MTASTPADLAVTFRSLARRSREAIGDAEPSALGDVLAELQGHIERAAALVGSAPDAEAVATAIESRRADEWEGVTLEGLRQEALDAGATLRRLAAAAEAQQAGA